MTAMLTCMSRHHRKDTMTLSIDTPTFLTSFLSKTSLLSWKSRRHIWADCEKAIADSVKLPISELSDCHIRLTFGDENQFFHCVAGSTEITHIPPYNYQGTHRLKFQDQTVMWIFYFWGWWFQHVDCLIIYKPPTECDIPQPSSRHSTTDVSCSRGG